jgi:hypothetical protein
MWRPLHIYAPYLDGKMNQKGAMIILLPTGVADEDTRDVHFTVVEYGQVLLVDFREERISDIEPNSAFARTLKL